jgi:SPP1 family predicted phage head-tail adaptor
MVLNLDPGLLRAELALQEASLASDGMGGRTETWTTVATVFARIEPVAARSTFGADQTIETVTHRITIRRREDIRSGMRFVKSGRIFEITTIHDPDETGRYLVCSAKEEGR